MMHVQQGAAWRRLAQLESQHSLKMDDLKRIDQEASDALWH
jgi:hypothetical protein